MLSSNQIYYKEKKIEDEGGEEEEGDIISDELSEGVEEEDVLPNVNPLNMVEISPTTRANLKIPPPNEIHYAKVNNMNLTGDSLSAVTPKNEAAHIKSSDKLSHQKSGNLQSDASASAIALANGAPCPKENLVRRLC